MGNIISSGQPSADNIVKIPGLLDETQKFALCKRSSHHTLWWASIQSGVIAIAIPLHTVTVRLYLNWIGTIDDLKELLRRFKTQINGFALVEIQFQSLIAFKKLSGGSSNVPIETLFHWKNVYRKIIGIYRNFDGKLLNSCLTTVSQLFLVLIAPILLFLLLFISNLKYLLDWNCW